MSVSEKKINFNELTDHLVSAEFLASCFECSERTIFRYAENKDLPRTSEGKYPLFKSLLWYISKLKKEIEESSEDNPLVRAKLETQNLINKEKSMRLLKETGKLVPSQWTEIYMSNVFKLIGSRLDGLGYDINIGLKGDSASLKRINDCINDVRRDIIDHCNLKMSDWMKEFEDPYQNNDQSDLN